MDKTLSHGRLDLHFDKLGDVGKFKDGGIDMKGDHGLHTIAHYQMAILDQQLPHHMNKVLK